MTKSIAREILRAELDDGDWVWETEFKVQRKWNKSQSEGMGVYE